MTIETEVGNGAATVRECWQPLEAEGGGEWILLESPQAEHSPANILVLPQ